MEHWQQKPPADIKHDVPANERRQDVRRPKKEFCFELGCHESRLLLTMPQGDGLIQPVCSWAVGGASHAPKQPIAHPPGFVVGLVVFFINIGFISYQTENLKMRNNL